jgi:hypothetical protein
MLEIIYKGEVIAKVKTLKEAEIIQKEWDGSYIVYEERMTTFDMISNLNVALSITEDIYIQYLLNEVKTELEKRFKKGRN